jgi:hypothetical protein
MRTSDAMAPAKRINVCTTSVMMTAFNPPSAV